MSVRKIPIGRVRRKIWPRHHRLFLSFLPPLRRVFTLFTLPIPLDTATTTASVSSFNASLPHLLLPVLSSSCSYSSPSLLPLLAPIQFAGVEFPIAAEVGPGHRPTIRGQLKFITVRSSPIRPPWAWEKTKVFFLSLSLFSWSQWTVANIFHHMQFIDVIIP